MAKRRGARASGFAEADGAAYLADISNALDLSRFEGVIEDGVAEALRPVSDPNLSIESLEAEVRRRAQEATDDPSSLIPIEYLLPILNEIDRRVALRSKKDRD